MITSFKDNKYVVYLSAFVAAEQLNIPRKRIANVLIGRNKTYKDYKFRYSTVEEINSFFDNQININDENLEHYINNIDDRYKLKELMKKQYLLNIEWKNNLNKFYENV
jgi:ABC-type Na+ transport system ATPase subunit NatA